jgi:TonB family protein
MWSFCQVNEPPEIGSDEFVLLEKEPEPINLNELSKMISYPLEAKASEIQGKVVLRVQIDTKGNYVKHMVIKDPHPILTQAVESKIAYLKFTPGIQKGKPIKVWVTIPFDFKLLPKEQDETAKTAEKIVKTTYYDLQEALKHPNDVQELNLQGQGLKAFPMKVLQFPNLKRLELNHNEISSIPAEIYALKNLEWLGMAHNKLVDLPEDLWLLPRLKGINIQENGFSKKMKQSLAKDHTYQLYPKDEKGKVQW